MNGVDVRRALVRESQSDSALTPINGIDFLEVDPVDERTFTVTFLFDVDTDVDPPQPHAVGDPLSAALMHVLGGERITSVAVTKIARVASAPNRIAVTVDRTGDFSPYTLVIGRLPDPAPAGEPVDPPAAPRGFDPVLCSVPFLFHVECAKRFDCKRPVVCPPAITAPPPIDYLARDYPAFVRVMLDRLSLLAPRWSERNPADLGVALVEVLAYVGDQLSYRHDVVDTEAYLGTARLRTSARRHARLVDYSVDDGCNARVWLALTLSNDLPAGVPAGTRCCTGFAGASGPDLRPEAAVYQAAIDAGAEFFEILADRFTADEPPVPLPRALLAANNAMKLYGWSATTSCLPTGATSATLDGAYALARGDFVMFAEVCGPLTGIPADADPAKRHVVRLTRDAEAAFDPLYGTARPVTRIAWGDADALPFPLCLDSVVDAMHGSLHITGVSAAYGNVVLADHGRTLGLPLEAMPEPLLPAPAPARFRPTLAEAPLTFVSANPYVHENADANVVLSAARAASGSSAGDALPAVTLSSLDAHGHVLAWQPARDLLIEPPGATAFVVEVENDGTPFLRFGDGAEGMASTGLSFTARYRAGNGSAGNVGRDSIVLIDRSFPGGGFVSAVTNPLPAWGGRDPETIEHVRQNAPVAFRTQLRAVTAQDYADRAMQVPGVARAAARFRWTGSWLTVFVTVQPRAVTLDRTLKAAIVASLDVYRMAGVDLEVEEARRVPLRIAMHVCAAPGYIAADVERALTETFGSGALADGTPAFFNPVRFTMGRPYYLSPLYAAAQAIEGVQSVRIDVFEREAVPSADALRTGVLAPGPLEFFELANDPSYPERGIFKLSVDGGL